jgi:RHS repeat-associated protein
VKGAERVAMRTGDADPLWLVGDHLGSTSVAANYDGTLYTRQGYKAWGVQRFIQGISPLPTTFRYTGQREDSYIKLYWYGSRWYDPYITQFSQPDSIVPLASQGTQAFDRYAYVNNDPIRYNDPFGHCTDPDKCSTDDPVFRESKCKEEGWYSCLAKQNYHRQSKYYEDCARTGGVNCPHWVQIAVFTAAAMFVASGDIILDVGINLFNASTTYLGVLCLTNDACSKMYYFLVGIGPEPASGEVSDSGALTELMPTADDLTNAPEIPSGTKFPITSPSEWVVRKGSDPGFAYYEDGNIVFRVDLTGKADQGVATPHLQWAIWDTKPDTGEVFFRDWIYTYGPLNLPSWLTNWFKP